MKRHIPKIIVATIALAVVAYFLFFRNTNNETNLLSKVPAEANSVAIANISGLTTRLVVDELSSKESRAKRLLAMLPDSLALVDWGNSGINLLDKMVLFTTGKDPVNYHLLMQISDYKSFTNFSDSLATLLNSKKEKNKVGGQMVSKKYNLMASWSKEFIIVSSISKKIEKQKSDLQNLLLLEKEKSILIDSTFSSKLNHDFDVLVYTNPSKIRAGKNTPPTLSNIISTYSFLKFYDGELDIRSEIAIKHGSLMDKLFSKTEKQIRLLNKSDSCALFAELNIEGKSFLEIIKENTTIKLNESKIPLLKVWDGSANVILNNIKTIENEYISYEYDDDFNKIEVKKKTTDKIIDIQSNIGFDKIAKDTFLAKKRLQRKGCDTLLFKGSNFIISNSGESFICYNKHIEKPNLAEELSKEQLYIELNWKSLQPVLKEFKVKSDSLFINRFDIERIELQANKNMNLDIDLKIFFANKDKNSLFSLVEGFEKKLD